MRELRGKGPKGGSRQKFVARRKERAPGYNELKRIWQSSLTMLARQQLRTGHVATYKGGLMRFVWIERNRHRDPDNICAGGRKIILDAFVDAGVLPDKDGWRAGGFKFADEFRVTENVSPGIVVAWNFNEAGDPAAVFIFDGQLPDLNEVLDARGLDVRRGEG